MKIAILYDFDKTLSYKDMQEYGFFDDLKIEDRAIARAHLLHDEMRPLAIDVEWADELVADLLNLKTNRSEKFLNFAHHDLLASCCGSVWLSLSDGEFFLDFSLSSAAPIINIWLLLLINS